MVSITYGLILTFNYPHLYMYTVNQLRDHTHHRKMKLQCLSGLILKQKYIIILMQDERDMKNTMMTKPVIRNQQ